MSDNPREILALLNSFGFVGITAPQLKAFLKDLKLYRKAKERMRQERKEEMTNKILSKQQAVIQEMLNGKIPEIASSDTLSSSEAFDLYTKDPMVKVRVKYVSDSDSENVYHNNGHIEKEKSKTVISKDEAICYNKSCKYGTIHDNNKHYPKKHSNIETKIPAGLPMDNVINRNNECSKSQEKTSKCESVSSKASGVGKSKSFIRPKVLQPNSQKGSTLKRMDPVSLYQKYQKEWKQLSLPGEAKHTAVRWAIREKMLGFESTSMQQSTRPISAPLVKQKLCSAA